MWKQLGSKAHDYNLSFATGSAQALQAALGSKEAVDIKCVFRADLGDDWPRYLKTYGAGAPPLHPPTPVPPFYQPAAGCARVFSRHPCR